MNTPEYQREYRRRDPEKWRKYQRDYRKTHIRSQKNSQMVWNWHGKLDAINALGGKCVCCGENRPTFLTIDHANGDGASKRREAQKGVKRTGAGSKMYAWIKKNPGGVGDLQVLCWNCNCSRGFFGYCHPQLVAEQA